MGALRVCARHCAQACVQGDVQAVQTLLKAGALPNVLTKNGPRQKEGRMGGERGKRGLAR